METIRAPSSPIIEVNMSINKPAVINGVSLPKCCANCDFYEVSQGPQDGLCRRMPPQLIVVYTIKETTNEAKETTKTETGNGHSLWPPVKPSTVCGEWELKPDMTNDTLHTMVISQP